MKEVSILYNGKYITKGNNDTKIFLHVDENSNIIHLVEGTTDNFKRRIEFKKRAKDNNKYITFSNYLTPTIVFSGDLIITEDNFVIGNISLQVLKENSTNIIEAYYLRLNLTDYYLDYIITANIRRFSIESNPIEPITLPYIEIFLFNILNKINNTRSIKNKTLIPYPISISKIFQEEQIILNIVKNLIDKYPELNIFLEQLATFKRKRTISYWLQK